MLKPNRTITSATLLFASLQLAAAQGALTPAPTAQPEPAPASPTLPVPESHPPATREPQVYRPPPSTQTAPMRVRVMTSTTFHDILSGATFRLYGIDACDPNQTARMGQQPWACGTVATAWLTLATLNKWIACTPIRSEAEIIIARCATSEYADVAAEMLRAGYAVRLPEPPDRQISEYEKIEDAARKAYRGLWASQFQMPWDYRANPIDEAPEQR